MTLAPLPEFSGKNVVITGASGGLGAAAAEYFARAGANLVLVDLAQDSLEETAASLVGAGAVHTRACDISNRDQVTSLVDEVAGVLGSVDVLLNIAGLLGPIGNTESYPYEDFERILRVNTLGTYLVTRAALPHMRRAGGGAIVNVSSVSAIRGYANEVGYGASKAAVTQITRNVAMEYAAYGIRVNAVAPGWIETKMMSALNAARSDADRRDDVTRYGPSGRAAEPGEVVEAIAFLASPRASYINATVLTVDGGLTAC